MKSQDPSTREEAAKAALVQRLQLEELTDQKGALEGHKDKSADVHGENAKSTEALESVIESLKSDFRGKFGSEQPSQAALDNAKLLESLELDQSDHETIDADVAQLDFNITLVPYEGDWSTYIREVEDYARSRDIDLSRDPFQSLLSDRQRGDILKRIETDFDEKCDCDRWDYAIAACCGALAGLVDVFLVGEPKDSLLGGLSDNATDRLVQRFARLCGWKGPRKDADATRSAIGRLERVFKVNYDHRHGGDVDGRFEMSAKNHHIKSLAHSPSPIGLLFSVLDQFTDRASFIADGRLIRIRSDSQLQGSNFPSKLFAAFFNWIGHILSDVAGASGSEGRGSGVPIPFFELLQFVNIGSFGKERRTLAELAVKMFEEGYDARFGGALAVPVLITELFIRVLWVVKRRYRDGHDWSDCKPSAKQPSLRRMLLVGHGSLALVDLTDAAARAAKRGLQPAAMLIHMNFVAWIRFGYLGWREVHGLINKDAERMRRIDETIDAELKELLADSALTHSSVQYEAFRPN